MKPMAISGTPDGLGNFSSSSKSVLAFILVGAAAYWVYSRG
jgi:hypothetical protein